MIDPTTLLIPPGAPDELERVDTPEGRFYRLDGRLVPSVTTVLDATREESPELQDWRATATFDEIATAEHHRDVGAERGTMLDELVEAWLWHRRRGEGDVWESAVPLFRRIDRVHASQLRVASRRIGYAGTLDHVVTWMGTVVIVDTKLKRKRPKTAYLHDYAVQVAAYRLAMRELEITVCGRVVEHGVVACCVPGLTPTGRQLRPTELLLAPDELDELEREWCRRHDAFMRGSLCAG